MCDVPEMYVTNYPNNENKKGRQKKKENKKKCISYRCDTAVDDEVHTAVDLSQSVEKAPHQSQ